MVVFIFFLVFMDLILDILHTSLQIIVNLLLMKLYNFSYLLRMQVIFIDFNLLTDTSVKIFVQVFYSDVYFIYAHFALVPVNLSYQVH